MGLLRISQTQTWKASGALLEKLLDRMQQRLQASEPELAAQIGLALRSGLPWWTLTELNPQEYRCVMAATEQIQTQPSNDDANAPDAFASRLADLVILLRQDPRALPVVRGP